MTEVMTSLSTSLLIFLAIEQMDMGRDVTAFRERFKAYKNGKSVSEIYDAGLPRYAGGTPGLTKAQEAALDELYEWGNSLGYDTMSIAGIGGNGLQESGLNYNAKSKSGYAGLLQNNKNIQQAIIEQYGDYSPASQRQYIHDWNTRAKWITKGKYSPHTATNSGRYKTKGYTSTDEASDAWMKLYERPVILDSNGKVIGYQEQDKRRAYTKLAYEYLNNKYGKPQVPAQEPSPYIAKPISTAVRPTIPAEQTVPAYDPTISPYISGKPMVKLRPRVQLPNLVEVMEDSEWEPGFPGLKNGKLPGYKDGTRYLWDDQKGEWDRITDNEYARAFADLTVTPKSNRQDIRTNPVYHDPRLKNAGYVTESMLEDEANSVKQRETGIYAQGLEQVSPEFDLLTGIRALMPTINGLDRKIYHIAREMNKGLKKNPILKSYNSGPSYLDTGGNVLQYQDYINSLFPNSKVKDIVYHCTWAKPFEQFDPGKIKRGYGFYFSPSENHLPFDRMVYSRVNIQNPLEIFPNKNRNLDVTGLWRKDITEQAIKNGQHDGIIGVSNMRNPGEPEIVALNPNQIHILGSNRDVKQFSDFMDKINRKPTK